jgi:pimeloyl-ACP methyl ester carboxylesterase
MEPRPALRADRSLDHVDAGDGPAVFLLHGSERTPAMWHDLQLMLSSRFRTIAPDLAGLGEIDAVPAVRGLMDALGVERVAVVGHGSGGATALLLAAADPRVDGLVLIDTKEVEGAGIEGPMAAWTFPVFILWGEDDEVVPVGVAERLNDAIPASTLGLVPGCGHHLVEEAGETIGPMIHEYLRARYAHEPHGHEEAPGVVMLQLERRPPWVDLQEDEADPWFDGEEDG